MILSSPAALSPQNPFRTLRLFRREQKAVYSIVSMYYLIVRVRYTYGFTSTNVLISKDIILNCGETAYLLARYT